MQTVAVLENWEADIGLVLMLLPGLKRLWFDIDESMYDFEKGMATRKSRRVKAFSLIKFPNLVGATVNFDWKLFNFNGEDEGMEERLEHALLDN